MSDHTKDTPARGASQFYRGPAHLEDSAEVKMWREDEFPNRKDLAGLDRRDFLKFMGGTVALASVAAAGCRNLPNEPIVPFVLSPENRVPGVSKEYATAYEVGGYGIGLTVRSNEGRPTKIEGNPKHPASLGSVDARTLAQTNGLYDPDRLKLVHTRGGIDTWPGFLVAARKVLEEAAPVGGNGIALLTETVGSPTMAQQIEDFLKAFPNAKWHQYEPVNRDNQREGAILAYGRDAHPTYDFTKAKVVVALDSHLLIDGPAPVRYGRDLASQRAVAETSPTMSRIYSFESSPTLIGAMADHKLPVRASAMLSLAKAIAGRIGVGQGASVAGVPDGLLGALAADLTANRGASVVVCGDHLPPAVHAVCHAINAFLLNVGSTVTMHAPVHANPVNQAKDFADLCASIQAQQVKALFIIGGNPVYTAGPGAKFAELAQSVPFSAHLSLYDDETSETCGWQLPMSHFLETWGDTRAFDGTAAIAQPLIAPLYDCKSGIEFLDALMGRSRSGYDIVRDRWLRANRQAEVGTLPADPAAAEAAPAEAAPRAPVDQPGTPIVDGSFEDWWTLALADGVVPGSALPVAPVTVNPTSVSAVTAETSGGLELVLLPDPTIYDGRYANNGWMQELPKPMSQITWDNALYMSRKTAGKLGIDFDQRVLGVPFVGDNPMADVTVNGRTLRVAVCELMGTAEDTVVLTLGYGRRRGGKVAVPGDRHDGGGFDAYSLRTPDQPAVLTGVEVKPANARYPIATTQYHSTLDVDATDSGRYIIRHATIKEYEDDPAIFTSNVKEYFQEKGFTEETAGVWIPPSMYRREEFRNEEVDKWNYQWAMSIDLNLCTGCNACVTACQSENNIPVVGKKQVVRGREMHWIRIDRYYQGTGGKVDEDNPPTYVQPLTCMMCENAPCEPVCPVAATVHSHEGLNQMVYNRCVGTRYCSNNCPYKVRRFNFLNYADKKDIPVIALLQNPDVTIRGRGVMEKCTYCVQRINKARIQAKLDDREIEDGEVQTACQQACPGKAIIFGDKRREQNAVTQSRLSKRTYVLLEETNTIPRTTYLARIHNPNPEVGA